MTPFEPSVTRPRSRTLKLTDAIDSRYNNMATQNYDKSVISGENKNTDSFGIIFFLDNFIAWLGDEVWTCFPC